MTLAEAEAQDQSAHGWRFWAIIISLSITSILSALDVSVIATALPSIVRDLGADSAYIWVANACFLTMTAFQPLYGQTANIFGRRSLTLLAVFLFAAGSAISGAAPNLGALIGGRAIRGIGGGGINIMIEIIVADLVPLRHRPKYIRIIFTSYTVVIALGPVIGGLLAEWVPWRWVFYLNLPVAGTSLVLLFIVLRVRYVKRPKLDSFKRVDFGGNFLLVASVASILLALTWGGVEFAWISWRTLVPLLVGFVGLVPFLVVKSTSWILEPTMPIRIFNRISLAGFGLTFIHSMLIYWLSYFLPLYFQFVLEVSPLTSGVDLLPSVVVAIPFAIIAGAGLSRYGRHHPWHFLGISSLAICFGLCSRLDENSTTAYWAGIQSIGAIGTGILTTTTLPAIQAPLDEKDQAVSTATWGFVRSFGGVWGVAIPAAVFNSKVNELVFERLDDKDLINLLANGGAYSLASGGFISSLASRPMVQTRVKGIYVDALRLSWQVGIGFALIGFLIAYVVKEITLRTGLQTDFGMEARETNVDGTSAH